MSTTEQTAATWTGHVTDEEQPKAPIIIGIATGVGALLWLAPFMGLNSVLNPQKLANIMGGAGAEVNNYLAMLGTLGAIVSTITTIIIGALTDITRSRLGRRTPWILAGSVLTALVMVGLGLVQDRAHLWIFTLLWCLIQTFINMIVAPLIAVIADRTAPKHRGLISSVYAIGYIIGQYGGPVIGGRFMSTTDPGLVNTGYYALAVMMLLSGPVAAILMREKSSLAMPKKKFDGKVFAETFKFPTKGASDLYKALFGKMMINIAVTGFSTYQVFYLTSGMGADQTTAGKFISAMGVATMITAIIFAPLSGPVSDFLKTRKKLVAFSAVLTAIGTIIPFFYRDPSSMIWYGVVAGIGAGIFFSVDQALNIEVLPNPENAAKDLGILNFANTGAQILAPVVGAILFQVVGGQYMPILPCLSVIALIGAVLVMMIKKVR